MSASEGFDLTSIPERIQSEVQRAIQRSIKGVEYISSAGPSLGSTPKDTLAVRGTMNLYHYRPMADEVYRIPVLIVMATTNRGYILDLVPGQSFIEFLLKRGYDVYMLDWTPPKPEEKHLRMEDYVLDFIPDCVRRVGAMWRDACSAPLVGGCSLPASNSGPSQCRDSPALLDEKGMRQSTLRNEASLRRQRSRYVANRGIAFSINRKNRGVRARVWNCSLTFKAQLDRAQKAAFGRIINAR